MLVLSGRGRERRSDEPEREAAGQSRIERRWIGSSSSSASESTCMEVDLRIPDTT